MYILSLITNIDVLLLLLLLSLVTNVEVYILPGALGLCPRGGPVAFSLRAVFPTGVSPTGLFPTGGNPLSPLGEPGPPGTKFFFPLRSISPCVPFLYVDNRGCRNQVTPTEKQIERR